MRKLFLLAGLLALASCTKERIRGSGPVTTEDRSVANFTKIEASGSTNVHITHGPNFSVKVKGYSNLLPYYETVVNSGTLALRFQDGVNVSNNNVEVFVTMPELASLQSSGSSNADINGPFQGEALAVNVSGSGTVLIEGTIVNRFTLTVSGDGDLKAFGMLARRADIGISGRGKIEITVADHLKVNISGSGVVYYKGNPTSVESDISGSGKLVHQP